MREGVGHEIGAYACGRAVDGPEIVERCLVGIAHELSVEIDVGLQPQGVEAHDGVLGLDVGADGVDDHGIQLVVVVVALVLVAGSHGHQDEDAPQALRNDGGEKMLSGKVCNHHV